MSTDGPFRNVHDIKNIKPRLRFTQRDADRLVEKVDRTLAVDYVQVDQVPVEIA